MMKKMYCLHLGCGILLIGSAFISIRWLPLHLLAVLISMILLYNACSCRWIPLPLESRKLGIVYAQASFIKFRSQFFIILVGL